MLPSQNLIEKIDDGAVYVNYEEDQITSQKREDEWTRDTPWWKMGWKKALKWDLVSF